MQHLSRQAAKRFVNAVRSQLLMFGCMPSSTACNLAAVAPRSSSISAASQRHVRKFHPSISSIARCACLFLRHLAAPCAALPRSFGLLCHSPIITGRTVARVPLCNPHRAAIEYQAVAFITLAMAPHAAITNSKTRDVVVIGLNLGELAFELHNFANEKRDQLLRQLFVIPDGRIAKYNLEPTLHTIGGL